MTDLRVHVDGIGEVVAPWNDRVRDWEVRQSPGFIVWVYVDEDGCWGYGEFENQDTGERDNYRRCRPTPDEALRAVLEPLAHLLPDEVKARLRGEAKGGS